MLRGDTGAASNAGLAVCQQRGKKEAARGLVLLWIPRSGTYEASSRWQALGSIFPLMPFVEYGVHVVHSLVEAVPRPHIVGVGWVYMPVV